MANNLSSNQVFISYSHKDEAWKGRLLSHLSVFGKQGLPQAWSDRSIGVGDEWVEGIQRAMENARVVIILISADFLTSEFIRHVEVPYLLERQNREGIKIFPVLCKTCLWQAVPWLAESQILPRHGRALASFRGGQLESELSKIAEEILSLTHADPVVRKTSHSTGIAIGKAVSTFYQLPSPPVDFTGRKEELAFMRTALTQGGVGAIFALRGMGGIGKTALALKLAEELVPRYPDAQLYLDLKGGDPQSLTAVQAMTHIMRTFHPEARFPESESELAGLYRSTLFGKRTLLLLDNAASREQVEPLIPPAGSLLLVTSRFRFALPGVIARDLGELSDEEARELLLRIDPRIGNESGEIALLCGRLPLALRLAGSALAERPDLSPVEYARRLRQGEERFAPMEASLKASYELLNAEYRRLWRMLAVFPETFNVAAVAAVWEMQIDPAKEALWALVRCSLVDWEEKEDRFRLHAIARPLMYQSIEAIERSIAERRHAEHFLEVVKFLGRLYGRGGKEVLLALKLFDNEWSNIQAGYAWAASHFLEDAEAARLCGDYLRAGSYLFELRQHPQERLHWTETALAAARHRKDRAAEAIHLGGLGLAYEDLGNPRRAVEFYEQYLTIDREMGNRLGEGQALGLLGHAYASLGEPRRAVEFYEQYLVIAREIGNRRGEGQVLSHLGNAYADFGEPWRAIDFYEQGLTIVRDIGDRREEGRILGNLGLTYADLGEPRRAIQFYEQWLAIAREIGDRRGEGTALGDLGLAYADLDDSVRAIEFYEQRLAIAREIGDRQGEVNTNWNLGLIYEKQGELTRAIELMQILVEFEQEIGHSNAEKHNTYVEALRARHSKGNF